MTVNSRSKGKRGELEFARLLSDRGFPAHRGRQYSGGPDSPDVVCESLPIHFEVKLTERLRIYPALAQALQDSSDDEIPVVAYRRNRESWLVILRAEDFMEILRGGR